MKKRYCVNLNNATASTIVVDASTSEEAVEMAKRKYDDGEYASYSDELYATARAIPADSDSPAFATSSWKAGLSARVVDDVRDLVCLIRQLLDGAENPSVYSKAANDDIGLADFLLYIEEKYNRPSILSLKDIGGLLADRKRLDSLRAVCGQLTDGWIAYDALFGEDGRVLVRWTDGSSDDDADRGEDIPVEYDALAKVLGAVKAEKRGEKVEVYYD